MADYITTDTDLMNSGLITANNKSRLTPLEWVDGDAGQWTPRHEEAWTHILQHLANLPTVIEEDDLASSDVTALKPASLHYVLYLAWTMGGELDKAKFHHQRYLEELGNVRLTLSGSEAANVWGRGIELCRV